MKLKLKWIATLSLALLIFFSQMMVSPQEVVAAQAKVVLSGVKGEVLVKKGGGLRELPALDGMELVQGDWLRTGKTGTVKLSYEDGTEAMLGSSSSINIQRLTRADLSTVSAFSEARVNVSQNGLRSSMQLWSGSIWSKVKSLVNLDDSYEVETPTAVMGVRGTMYLVSVNPEDGSTQGDVIDGVVGVTQNQEATQAAPIQLVTMGQTLRLVSLTEPLPNQQVISPEELIKTTQSEILVQLVNDIIERTKELAVLTKEQQKAFDQTGNLDDIKAAIGTSFKLEELASFGKEFMTSLQSSEKLEEIKQTLKENNQSLEQVQSTINTLRTETEQIRTEVVKTAKEAGVSQEQIDNIGKEAVGVTVTPETGTPPQEQAPPAPPAPPATTESSGGGGDNSGDSSNTTASLGAVIPIVQNTPITFTGGIKLDLGGLSIPSGATVKAVEVNSAALPVGTRVAGKVVNFTFSGMTVDNSVSVTLPINPSADPKKVGIFYLNGSEWEYQNSTVMNGTVVATVNHFSTYGVLAPNGKVELEGQFISSDGKQIKLIFDKTLFYPSIPAVTDFLVTQNSVPIGVTKVTLKENSIILDLAQTVYKNDQVKISYTVGSKHICDLSGNSVDGFVDRPVETGNLAGPKVFADSLSSLKVVLNQGPVNIANVTFTVLRDATPVPVTAIWNTTYTEATLTSTTVLPKGSYMVTVTKDGIVLGTSIVVVDAQKIAAINITSTSLDVGYDPDNGSQMGYVTYNVMDQYGNDVTRLPLGSSVSFQSGVGTVSARDGLLTLVPSAGIDLLTYSTVVITGYDSVSGVLTNAELEVRATTVVADFALTGKTDTTATFTWTPVVGATEIKIEKALSGTSAWDVATTGTISVNESTATVTELTASTSYDFRLVVTGGTNAGISNVLVNILTVDESTGGISGDYSYTITATGEAQITEYSGAGGVVTIPSTLDGVPVTSIGEWAFSGCTSITAITIPEGVSSIGFWAFEGCTGLISISLPEGFTNIGDEAFYNCKSLTTLSIPESVTSIGDWAFASCTGLKSISLPEGVANIAYGAFNGCIDLISIKFNSATTTIYDHADTIPEEATIIGYELSTAKTYAANYGRMFQPIDIDNILSVTLSIGSTNDTVKALFEADNSFMHKLLISSLEPVKPGIDSTVPGEAIVYISGEDIVASQDEWLIIYEVNSSDKVVRYFKKQLTHEDLCADCDPYEPNNDYAHATILNVDGDIQTHTICHATDEDWFKFDAQAGTFYEFQTLNLVPDISNDNAMDTSMYLYDKDGATLLEHNDDFIDLASRINWLAPSSDTYYVKIIHFDYSAEQQTADSVGQYDIFIKTSMP